MLPNFRRKAFTLVEIVLYVGIFAVAAIFLSNILVVTLKVQNKESATNAVNQQLNFVLDAVQRLVRNSSLVEKVYEGTDEAATCVKFCAVKLRMEKSGSADPDRLDPTIVRSDASGVYLKQGPGTESALTNNKIILNNFNLTKFEVPGGHALLQVDASMTYAGNPAFAVTRSISSAIGRVSAATFDSDILPNNTSSFDVGQSSSRWQDGWFSGSLNLPFGVWDSSGNVGIGMTSPTQKLEINGGIILNTATTKPTCNSTVRGTFWVFRAAAGIKDDVQVCAKDAANVYAWRTIY